MELRTSVRALVEFVMRSGDLDNRTAAAPERAMQEGSRMHRQLQSAAGGDYRAEVPLQLSYVLTDLVNSKRDSVNDKSERVEEAGKPTEAADRGEIRRDLIADPDALWVTLEGRADGIYTGTIPFDEKNCTVLPDAESGMLLPAVLPDWEQEEAVTIDEIKTTYRRLSRMKAPEPVHLAQARCYAYMYACENAEEVMHIRMTYCNLASQELHYYYERMTFEALDKWFRELMKEYERWARFLLEWQKTRDKSIGAMSFPYEYRAGQRELAAGVYQTIIKGRKLFLEAPTGTGKTLATVYPSLKAIGEGRAQKLFYLTAKTVTRTVAENTMELLRERGLRCKNVVITAKEKICVLEKPECNPDKCPRALGHFDRINDAMYELLTGSDNFDREAILACAERHNVCPFELSLDMSLFSDTILCDYNYLFDPHAYLRRFFAGGETRGAYLFLVDEAHNLVDRGRDMYSAQLTKEEFLKVRRRVKEVYPQLSKKLERCNKALLELKKRLQGNGRSDGQEFWSRNALDHILFLEQEEIETVVMTANAAAEEIAQIQEKRRIDEAKGKKKRSEAEEEVQEELLEFYFDLLHFLLMAEGLDDHYVNYARILPDGSTQLVLYCVDPGRKLRECMDRGTASILFSATFLPIQYYKSLLGGAPEDYEVYAQSVFDPERKGLFIASDVTSRYQRRSPEEFRRIAAWIAEIVQQRHGNYLVYCPSHSFLRSVADAFDEAYVDGEQITSARQRERMDETMREEFLARFEKIRDDRTFVGFGVLGGVFSEGIDLKNDALIGVIVVGTGLPQVCAEREILKNYFDQRGESGFDFAYRYPGMNKVLQAAGRVIRTAEDVGVVALLDDRFLTAPYRQLFPREWTSYEETDVGHIGSRVERFWNEWL